MTQLLPHEDPLRRCLKVHEWPEADQSAWEKLFEPGDILEGTAGLGQHWCEDTREKYRKGYGRWLTFLITSGQCEVNHAPEDRVTLEAVSAYIGQLSEEVASWTVWGRLSELLAVCKAMAPAADWSWLNRAVRRLEAQGRASKDKHSRLRPAAEISHWAYGELDRTLKAPPARHAETKFRDALLVGILIACPTMRLGNLTKIKIGQHLIKLKGRYELRFQGFEMKARKPIEIPVPESLTAYINHYIEQVRPILLDGNDSDRLWITQYGKPMTDKAIHAAISKATERAFGRAINPHLFRDCAVTSVAIEDPKHIGIAAPILGHTDPRTTEKHYIQAQQLHACRTLVRSLKDLRAQLQPAGANAKRRKH
ncbi:site-specific integrase [uncultured Roseovarius sp.]|uniref:tyrosine-type recombinase/integrase n=1 Tax=uncultured Roseovarius sp. TaxID=293344 RepID=UPI0025F66836|nr:site-specific integrase [uncultured Roseovarius sp.]